MLTLCSQVWLATFADVGNYPHDGCEVEGREIGLRFAEHI